jgi:putative membrane protein
VPLFNWIRDHFHLARNDYDRVGHFAQGFVPAFVAREVLLRQRIVLKRGWLFFIVLSICLAVSAAYELLEWRVAVGTGSAADAFLSTQGDPWDTQEDMATAAVGALTALLFFSRWHDRLIDKMEAKNAAAQAAG